MLKEMNNLFENVPSSSDMPETIDKKMVSKLAKAAERLEKAADRNEAIIKNKEELAGVIFNILFDDDGSIKDFCHTIEIGRLIDNANQQQRLVAGKLMEIISSIPTSVKAELSEEDRKRLDSNFRSWKDIFRLYLPAFSILGLIVGLFLMGSIMLSKSASATKCEYEQRFTQLENWYENNADAIAFGQFYRENFPKQYRQWHTGQWQQDIAYRDSLRRAHSLDRLKRLYKSEE